MDEYDGNSIQVLPGLESVRKRPGMYIGDIDDGSGLHELIWEVVGNVVDLHLRRDATELHVELGPDSWVVVRDDGPGIPVDDVPLTDVSVLQTVFSQLHAGATYDGHHPHVHLTHSRIGCGLAVVNALSTTVEVETTRHGVRYTQKFGRGKVVSDLVDLGPTTLPGTTIRFQPDPDIFKSVGFAADRIEARLQQVAWLNPLLRVTFEGQRLAWRGGLRGWATALAETHGPIVAAFSTCQTLDDVYVDLALAWTSAKTGEVRCFVNMAETKEGTHVDGIWQGLAAAVEPSGSHSPTVARLRERLEPGLVAIVHVGLLHPTFGGPSRDLLTSPMAGIAVARLLARELPGAAKRNSTLARKLNDNSRLIVHKHG